MHALSQLINRNSPDLVLFVGEALVGNDGEREGQDGNGRGDEFEGEGLNG